MLRKGGRERKTLGEDSVSLRRSIIGNEKR